MVNIGIIGVGGVGGYLGSHLTSYYEGSSDVRISLFARGTTARVLNRDGLTLKTNTKTTISRPFAIYQPEDEPQDKMDYVFVCVKSYSIVSVIELIRKIANSNATIIPFQNGVDGHAMLKELLPELNVINGCVYVMSRIESPAVIVESGIPKKTRFYYGSDSGEMDNLRHLESILKPSFDHIHLVDDIAIKVWTKFSRISTLSTIQTYYGITCGEIVANQTIMNQYIDLLKEFIAVALSEGYKLADDLLQESLDYVKITPFGMTTSMQRDFSEGKKSELEGQTGYIVRIAEKNGIAAPLYSMMYMELLKISQNSEI
ncbi:MAG: 2-dehydropantoate 2-reductase [Rikenellaceae bacterium]